MGCFLGCFKGSKDRKKGRKTKKSLPAYKSSDEKERYDLLCPSSSSKDIIAETEVTTERPLPKLIKNPDQGLVVNVRKKVTFDLNVTTFESVLVHQDSKDYSEDDAIEKEVQENKKDKEEEEEENTDAPMSLLFPQNHRYQNCESSDDEGFEEEGGKSDEDDEIDFDEGNDIDIYGDEEESYDSYFSLPMENQRLQFQEISSAIPTSVSATETELVVLTKGSVRDRSRYIHSVLNPVENLSHWKEVKVRPGLLKNLSKENINLDNETKPTILNSQEACTLASNPNPVFANQVAVDASLYNWLVSPKNSKNEPQNSKSILSNLHISSQEDCSMLGARTMEDIKQSPRTSSPRNSLSRTSEEIPVVGTVGGYWSSKSMDDTASSWSSESEKRGIPNTTSTYREVSWYCIPFETRVERALTMESRGTCSNVEPTA